MAEQTVDLEECDDCLPTICDLLACSTSLAGSTAYVVASDLTNVMTAPLSAGDSVTILFGRTVRPPGYPPKV